MSFLAELQSAADEQRESARRQFDRETDAKRSDEIDRLIAAVEAQTAGENRLKDLEDRYEKLVALMQEMFVPLAQGLLAVEGLRHSGLTIANRSAGGPVGLNAPDGKAVIGWPWPTGSYLKVAADGSHEEAFKAPPGWLHCDGGEVLIKDYPELFSVLGSVRGSSQGDRFRLPTNGQANGSSRFTIMIRT